MTVPSGQHAMPADVGMATSKRGQTVAHAPFTQLWPWSQHWPAHTRASGQHVVTPVLAAGTQELARVLHSDPLHTVVPTG
jgi:hypothetical protein